MKYYIKVENDYITDIITYEFENYIEINKDLWRFKYPLHIGLYTFKNGIIELDEEKEKLFLEEQAKIEEELIINE